MLYFCLYKLFSVIIQILEYGNLSAQIFLSATHNASSLRNTHLNSFLNQRFNSNKCIFLDNHEFPLQRQQVRHCLYTLVRMDNIDASKSQPSKLSFFQKYTNQNIAKHQNKALTDICMLKSTDIVRTITAHQRYPTKSFQLVYYTLL